MWIFTPDVAINTVHYKAIFTDGIIPVLSLELPNGDLGDSISFDCVETAVKAFDVVMNGIGANRKSVYLREIIDNDQQTRLIYEYDVINYKTKTNTSEDCIITDPREWDNMPSIQIPVNPTKS